MQTLSTSPSERESASMAYDPATGKMVLFGGYTGTSESNETWTYNGSTWEQQTITTSPSGRVSASMAYDPAAGEMVLFGGRAEISESNETYLLAPFVKSAPTLATSAPAAIRLGAKVKDEATLAGGEAPTGSIVFRLYGPEDEACTGAPAYTSPPVAVTGDGAYSSPEYAPSAPGAYRWIATYSGDANNSEVAGACNATGESVSVGKDSQTISFEALANHTLSEASVALSASASSHLEVSFKSLTPATCSVSGAIARLIAPGTCTIEATQAGNADYEAAPSIQRSFQIEATTTSTTTTTSSSSSITSQTTTSTTTTTTHATTTPLCPKLAVKIAGITPKRSPLFVGKRHLLGLRLLVGLSAPATLRITPELRFHLRGKARGRALRALSVSVRRARRLRIALPRALAARLRIGEALRVSLRVSAVPEAAGGCSPQVTELQLKATVRSLLVPRR
ncbi:MAG TPA: kelch repeat-containing protein [Solirubrobacteraceae bacterium]|nr:kelch repeat-containing protein [Solirubrobacteraceae bacterium]